MRNDTSQKICYFKATARTKFQEKDLFYMKMSLFSRPRIIQERNQLPVEFIVVLWKEVDYHKWQLYIIQIVIFNYLKSIYFSSIFKPVGVKIFLQTPVWNLNKQLNSLGFFAEQQTFLLSRKLSPSSWNLQPQKFRMVKHTRTSTAC